MFSIAVNNLSVLLMLLCQGCVSFQQLGKTEDTVQWGAQFMAHIGQECAF